MACFLEMNGVPFKPQAYEKAAHAVATLDRPIAEVYRAGGAEALDAVPAIGKGIAERNAGMLSTGKMAELERWRKETPVDILDLAAIEGVRPKRVRALYEGLGVRTLRAEVNIRPDGSVDLDDETLGELDLVGAAIHSHCEQPRDELTRAFCGRSSIRSSTSCSTRNAAPSGAAAPSTSPSTLVSA
jgi:hypothetical protein